MKIDVELLKKLTEFMDQNNLTELEYEDQGTRIKLKKAEPQLAAMANLNPSGVSSLPHTTSQTTQQLPSDNTTQILSPFVGTFYRSPKPGEPPYVEVGDEITPDKVVCIIESMKVMNEIKASVSGIIKEILIKDGQPVEYGEPLFIVSKKG